MTEIKRRNNNRKKFDWSRKPKKPIRYNKAGVPQEGERKPRQRFLPGETERGEKM